MAREKSYSEQLTEEYEQDWFDELNYKRTGHRNDAARELEKLLREIERMTRPKNIYYKAKKKKKAKIYGFTGRYGSNSKYMQNCTVKVSYEKNNRD